MNRAPRSRGLDRWLVGLMAGAGATLLGLAALASLLTSALTQRFAEVRSRNYMGGQTAAVARDIQGRLFQDPDLDLAYLSILLHADLPADVQTPGYHYFDLRTSSRATAVSIRFNMNHNLEAVRSLTHQLHRVRTLVWAVQAAYPTLMTARVALDCGSDGAEACVVEGDQPSGPHGDPDQPEAIFYELANLARFEPTRNRAGRDPDGLQRYQLTDQDARPIGFIELALSRAAGIKQAQTEAKAIGTILFYVLLVPTVLLVPLFLLARRRIATGLLVPLRELSLLVAQVDRNRDGHIDAAEADQVRGDLGGLSNRHPGAPLEIHRLAEASAAHLQCLCDTLRANQQAQEQLEEQKSRLQEASVQIGQSSRGIMLAELGSWVAHDLNNKLQLAFSIAQDWLTRDKPCPVSQLKHLQFSIQQTIKHIDELRNFSNPQRTGRTQARVELADVLAAARLLVGKGLDRAQVELTVEGPEHTCLRDADPGKLQDMLMNLMINARDAITERQQTAPEPPGLIALSYAVNEATLRLTVVDNGCGMPADQVESLFDRPYYTTKAKGTGLGMRIVWSAVRDHQGEIKAESEPGRGTTFVITLPGAFVETPAPASETEG